jgi:hypothetical protein
MSKIETPRERRNPQAHLLGQTPRQRGLEKFSLALRWGLKSHVTHPSIIDQLLVRMWQLRHPDEPARKTVDPRYLLELVRKGYFKAIHAPTLVAGAAYLLTSMGRDAALEAAGVDVPYETHPGSVHHSRLKHDLAVQRVCIRHLCDIDEITPERLMTWSGNRRPDALLTRNGKRVAIEAEISGKWKEELEQSLFSHAEALRQGVCDGVWYASNSKPLLDRYQRRLRDPMFPWHPYDEYGKPRTWTRGADAIVLPLEIQERFRFGHQRDLLRGFQHEFQGRTTEDTPTI